MKSQGKGIQMHVFFIDVQELNVSNYCAFFTRNKKNDMIFCHKFVNTCFFFKFLISEVMIKYR